MSEPRRPRPAPSNARDDWETPPEIFDALDAEFHFTLDVCARSGNAKCSAFISPEEDGLVQWWGGTCWMNPPYGRAIGKWVAKAHAEAQAGAVVVGFLPASTDTRWFHDHIYGIAEIRFIRGRVRFVGAPYNAPFPSMIVVWRPCDV